MTIQDPDAQTRMIEEAGQISLEFQQWLKELVTEVNALRTEVDDHETRITALEP